MPEEAPEEAKFAMAPMIDMVFLLLVFFMCASHLQSQTSIPLLMPFATKGVVPKERPERWIVNVLADGSVYSGPSAVSVDELKAAIVERRKTEPNLKIYLRADANAEHGEVKKVLRAMAEAGIDDFIFGVYSPNEG